MLGFGIECEPGELESLAEEYGDLPRTADWIEQHGGVSICPSVLDGVTPGTLELPANVEGIEVYNAGCELEIGRGFSAVHWDELAESDLRSGAAPTEQ